MISTHHNNAETCTPQSLFALAGVMALSTRLVQGWIFWAGASRRLFYDVASVGGMEHAVKMDPALPSYLAGKLMHAMPGSLFPDLVAGILQRGDLLLSMVWLWTIAELIVGIGLLLGLGTRLLAFLGVGLNISLMLIFGWMGSTCVDEWTMAACGFAMSATLMLTGGGSFAIDHWLARRFPAAGRSQWFRLIGSGPLALTSTHRWGLGLGILSLLFTVGFYQFLHGAVISPLKPRVSFHGYNIALSDARARPDGGVSFSAYINAGPDTGKLYVIEAQLRAGNNTLARWDGEELSELPAAAISNQFNQPWAAKIAPARYGLGAVTGAQAVIKLPAQGPLSAGDYQLELSDIDGNHWVTPVVLGD
jgi:thiosulfate dehydrogenase [quinone] large subunit